MRRRTTAAVCRSRNVGCQQANKKRQIHRRLRLKVIRDLRSLLDYFCFVRSTAVQAAVYLFTTGVMLAPLACIAINEIPVVSEGHVWNVDQLTAAIAHSASDALATQRNRRRMTGADAGSSLSKELSRGASGTWEAGRLAAGKLFSR